MSDKFTEDEQFDLKWEMAEERCLYDAESFKFVMVMAFHGASDYAHAWYDDSLSYSEIYEKKEILAKRAELVLNVNDGMAFVEECINKIPKRDLSEACDALFKYCEKNLSLTPDEIATNERKRTLNAITLNM